MTLSEIATFFKENFFMVLVVILFFYVICHESKHQRAIPATPTFRAELNAK